MAFERIIEWDDDGYPIEESLEKLQKVLNRSNKSPEDFREAIAAFYSALKENYYDACGPAEIEVRGKMEKVWEYHTYGWSGNESIINVLRESPLWAIFLERYDGGGHYYFEPEPEFE